MIRKLLVCIACLFLSSPIQAEPKALYEPEAVVKVTCDLGTGTAFRIADGRYITAGHVGKLAGCKINDQPVKLTILDDEHDIALFVGPKGGPIMPVSCDKFVPQRNYISIGYAFGWDTVTVEPLIAVPLEVEGFRAFIGEIIPGMSGGPVIGYDGKAYGVNNMRWPARSMSLRYTFVCKD